MTISSLFQIGQQQKRNYADDENSIKRRYNYISELGFSVDGQYLMSLLVAERGKAATLRPGASEISDVSEADIAELDQLISKLQNDVSELKKLM